MRIGYCVQGAADEAFVRGLRDRYCPGAELVAGITRGESRETLRREIAKNLRSLTSSDGCDYIVILTDSDEHRWRDVYNREWAKVPIGYQHLTVFGVAERNIECWIALCRSALAHELGCTEDDIPKDDASGLSGFIDRRFDLRERDPREKDKGKKRLACFVRKAPFKIWIDNSRSFKHFWEQIYCLGKQEKRCSIPNERNIEDG